jgi:hypothetical protein
MRGLVRGQPLTGGGRQQIYAFNERAIKRSILIFAQARHGTPELKQNRIQETDCTLPESNNAGRSRVVSCEALAGLGVRSRPSRKFAAK